MGSAGLLHGGMHGDSMGSPGLLHDFLGGLQGHYVGALGLLHGGLHV